LARAQKRPEKPPDELREFLFLWKERKNFNFVLFALFFLFAKPTRLVSSEDF
jgi:hypothetical protein